MRGRQRDAALARAAERRVGDFSSQDVTSFAWAFAMRLCASGLANVA